MSNFVSGLFLLAEKPFRVGDVIKMGNTRGTVHAIDFLSVKLRSLDDVLIRIPNANLFKSTVENFSHFTTRRVDLNIGVSHAADLEKVKTVYLDLCKANQYCIDEPEPGFIPREFSDSSTNILLTAWCQRENFDKLKNSLIMEIKQRFGTEGIEIPFLQIVVHHA